MGDNRVFKVIRNRYEEFFRLSPKVNSEYGKMSRLITEERYAEFFTTVMADPEIDRETKALVALLSTGCRISEVLSIEVNQLNFQASRVERVYILKKRKRDLRLNKPLIPVVVEFLKEFTQGREGTEKVLSFTSRHQPFRRLEKYFGLHPHDLRHAFVSYFLSRSKSLEKITAIQGWSSVSMAYTYANVDTAKEVDDFYKDVA